MKKYLILYVLLTIGSILYLIFQLQMEKRHNLIDKKGFVVLENKKFYIDGKSFFPMVVNYIVSLQTDGKYFWTCPSYDYNTDSTLTYSKDSCMIKLQADMYLIKQMGFNTVRIVGIGEEDLDKNKGELSIKTYTGSGNFTSFVLSDSISYNKYFDALEEMFKIIDNAGLKTIFLLRARPSYQIEKHLQKIAYRFRNISTIMAYDLYNEPLYFDDINVLRSKEEVYNITRCWHKIFKRYAPNQLTTIGLACLREVFEWDPNVVDVDFISFHPYEYEPEQVRNEMTWYNRYVTKPWIIGETAIPADNDSVSYEEQKLFAYKTLKQAYNCGASGYSWWQYKDVNWKEFHPSYMGVINRKGETKTNVKNYVVKGTIKPMAEEIKKFNPLAKKDSCLCLENYYNYSNGKKCRIIGYLFDENDKPIEGGVVLAWNQAWTSSYHTITKSNGSFEVLGTFPFYHWMASATLYSVVRGEALPDTAKIINDTIPTMNIGKLKVKKLSFPKWYHFNN